MSNFDSLFIDNKTQLINEFCQINGIIINPKRIYSILSNIFQLKEK